MLAPFLLASLLAAPGLGFPPAEPIRFDGEIAAGEWDGARVLRREDDEESIRVRFQRQGAWLAIGIDGKGPYRGEVLRLRIAGDPGGWIAELLFGLGQPAMPPLLWRRGSAERLRAADPSSGHEMPRGARVRVRVNEKEAWSAELLVRLAVLGIGRGDPRSFRGLVTVTRLVPRTRIVLAYPPGQAGVYESRAFAPIDGAGWGADERWSAVSVEESREFDDHALLFRLHREHEGFSLRQKGVGDLVISVATNPRTMVKVKALRDQLEAGQARNPTLPAWRYFLGRLLHEANLYKEARAVVEGIPEPLRVLDPFVNLAGEHYLDTQEFQRARDAIRGLSYVRGIHETAKLIEDAERVWKEEQKRVAEDAKKIDKLPRVKFFTRRGEFVVELFEDDAPLAVRNFMSLIRKRKYYDRQRFHQVGGGSFVTFGDPRTRPGSAAKGDGPAWKLVRDHSPRAFLRGYLATVPGPTDEVCHGSQAAFAVAPRTRATRRVEVFGRVVEGLDVLESIEQDDALLRIEIVHQRNHPYDAIKSRIQR